MPLLARPHCASRCRLMPPPRNARLAPLLEALEDRVLLSTAPALQAYRGVNAQSVFGGDSNGMPAWGINIVREDVQLFDQVPFDYGTIHVGQSYYHGLQGIVDNNRANGLITILCPFGWNGSYILNNTPSQTRYWSAFNERLAAEAKQFAGQNDVWLEVWNEPYDWSRPTDANVWLSDMETMVTSLRQNTGYTGTIVIPGGQEAGSESVILSKGKTLLNFDPQHNIVFDLHAYNGWFDSGEAGMESRIQSVLDAGVQMIFGEYGPATSAGYYNVAPFLQAVQAKGIGALAWHWGDADANTLHNGDGTLNNTAQNDNWASQALNYTLGTGRAALPAGWTDADVGSPAIPGNASDVDGAITLFGNGRDIWDQADQFNFMETTVNGDATLIARVTAIDNIDSWAKAGLMFRASDAADAPYVAVEVTPGSGLSLQARSTAGANAIQTINVGLQAAVWMKLARQGNTFYAWYATTPGTPSAEDWHALGMPGGVSIGSSYLAGLVVSSHNTGVICTATFANLTLAVAPQVTATAVNGGTAQRSMVGSVTYTFSAPVIIESGAFALIRRDDQAAIDLSIANPSGDQRTFVLMFAGPLVAGGSLANGIYDLTLDGTRVQDALGQALAGGSQTLAFYRLFGDANGDSRVNLTDYQAFMHTYLSTTGMPQFDAAFDANHDGRINLNDYQAFMTDYLRMYRL